MLPIRARDLRANIKAAGFEDGVTTTLEQFLDEYAGHRQHMRELTSMVTHIVDQLEKLVHIGGQMRDKLEEVERITKGNDGDAN